jgi:hypothetical protein
MYGTSLRPKEMDILTYLRYGLTVLCSAVGAFLAPVMGFILLSLVMVGVDFFSGVKAARVRGERITSHGYRRTLDKFTLYTTSILLSEGLEWVFFDNQFIPLTYTVAGFICVTELKSNFENMGVITGTNPWQVVRQYLERFIK